MPVKQKSRFTSVHSVHYLIFIFALGLAVQGCLPYEEEIGEIVLDMRNPELQTLLNYQDKAQADSLLPYFHREDPSLRYAAAKAFGSIRNPDYTDTLGFLLKDRSAAVRAAAAFSIGQSGGDSAEKLLLDNFDRYDTTGNYKGANRAILEAIGKCGSAELLESLATIRTYYQSDTALLEGQALGIYRYALRGITNPAGTVKMMEFVSNLSYPKSVRLIAANYLSRAREINLDTFTAQLAPLTSNEEEVDIRMALAIGLGKANRSQSLDTLISLYEREEDYRVKCNILRALGNFDYAQTQALAFKALRDPNPHIAQRAGQFFVDFGIPEDAATYRRTAKDTLPRVVQIALYRAANRHLPNYMADTRGLINYELRRKFEQAIRPYEKTAIVEALAEFPWNYRYLYQTGFKDSSMIVRTSSVNGLRAISNRTDLQRYFGSGYRYALREMANYFREAIETGSPGMINHAAEALANQDRNYRNFLDSLGFMDQALQKLESPRHLTTINSLRKAISALQEEPAPEPASPDYNHPIDWSVINNLPESTRAAIHTSKGTITIEMLPKTAPGSVANFLKLARQGYYQGNIFHRVVPNFVIQGGSPTGDGYGGLDYTIRSELSELSYDQAGYVGMARTGQHTEKTQFFITHSPTLHLDGNYTIFAKVVPSSMAVVHKIEIGDAIDRVSIR